MAGLVRRSGILLVMMALVMMALAVLPAATHADPPAPSTATVPWVTAVLGGYDGEAANGNRHDPVHTEFSIGFSGRPEGHYRVEEPTRSVDGTLTDFVALGPDRARFTWTDIYGTGPVEFTFDPARGRFLGYWGGASEINPSLIWTGERPGLTSLRYGLARPTAIMVRRDGADIAG